MEPSSCTLRETKCNAHSGVQTHTQVLGHIPGRAMLINGGAGCNDDLLHARSSHGARTHPTPMARERTLLLWRANAPDLYAWRANAFYEHTWHNPTCMQVAQIIFTRMGQRSPRQQAPRANANHSSVTETPASKSPVAAMLQFIRIARSLQIGGRWAVPFAQKRRR